MKKLVALFVIFSVIVVFSACDDDATINDYSEEEYSVITANLSLPEVVDNYELQLGEHFLPSGATYPQFNFNTRAERDKNNSKATLGRVMFYDKNLSLDKQVNCASCHKPERAFSDDQQFSNGVGEAQTRRNALSLATTLSFKISYSPIDPTSPRSKFSWDDASANLPAQVKNAFNKENEMNVHDDLILERLSENQVYPILFKKAYGDTEINSDRITEAISVFIDAISSINSKFDIGLESSPEFNVESNFFNFTTEENMGKTIYNVHCASCHTDKHNFTVVSTANNGLEMEYKDNGIGGRLNIESLNGVFKVPFLRNVGLTAPYMHDGRFSTLEEVVEHYNKGIVNHQNLSAQLKDDAGNPKKLNLNLDEKNALVAYLLTLNDDELINDSKFADPFK